MKNQHFIGLFLFALCLPLLGQMSGINDLWIKSTENRKLETLPQLKGNGKGGLIAQTDAWYKDNFGFRNALVHGYSKFKYHGLGVSPLPHKLVMGEEGWLYLRLNHLQWPQFDPEQHRAGMKILKQVLVKRGKKLAKHGIQLYLAVAPTKHSACPYNLPLHMRAGHIPAVLSAQISVLSDQEAFQVVDLNHQIPKDSSACDCFRKADLHWNELGGFWGAKELLTVLKKDFPEIQVPQVDNFNQITIQTKSGSHARIINLPMEADFIQLKPKSKAAEKIANNHVKAYIIHDSFFNKMKTHIDEALGESIYSHGKWGSVNWKEKEIIKEKPDVVILELSEMNIGTISSMINQPKMAAMLFN